MVTVTLVLPLPRPPGRSCRAERPNFKRGTIHSMHLEVRSFVIIWEDLAA